LKKNIFNWNERLQETFEDLKEVLYTTLILTLLDFNVTFILETDTNATGLEVMSSQKIRPLAYFSKAL